MGVAAYTVWHRAVDRAVLDVRDAIIAERVRAAVDDPLVLPSRVSRHSGFAARVAGLWPVPRRRVGRLRLIAALDGAAARTAGDDRFRARGLLFVADGRCAAAAEQFERIAKRRATDWNDLAVSYSCAAAGGRRLDVWLAALAAADRALELDPALAEAQFNRARIVDALGLTVLSRAAWQRYLVFDATSSWAGVARRAIASASSSDMDTWKRSTADVRKLAPDALGRLADRYREPARRYAEAYLSEWAAAVKKAKADDAREYLAAAHTIGEVLDRRGDAVIRDSVAAIESAATDASRKLATAHVEYMNGRVELKRGHWAAAEKHLRHAMDAFDDAGSPMTNVARMWITGALIQQQRSGEAAAVLNDVLTRVQEKRYPSLIGSVRYMLSLLMATHGEWSTALDRALEARSSFESIGERGNIANTNAVLSESYDLMGQPELAWKYGFAALPETVRNGDLDRTRVALAALCRTELRGKRWARALSLARLEAELAPMASDPRMDPDMFIRTATAEQHLGRTAAARQVLRQARATASHAGDPDTRRKQLADTDAAEGALIRREDPRRAIPLLSSAMRFQRESARPVFMPELFLQRGLAYFAMNEHGAAKRDFDAGIEELERQRANVAAMELRPGIFDDARDLFDAAALVEIARGAGAEAVFDAVERGRARAVLEQIGAMQSPGTTPRPARLRDVRAALGRRTALVEYASLPDRLIAFVVMRERVVMRTVPIGRDTLADTARAFIAQPTDGALLQKMLLAPIARDLAGVAAVNIVADDFLLRVPFHALFDPTTHTYAIERHVLATSPSAGVLLATMARMAAQAAPVRTAVVFANPAIPRDEFPDLVTLPSAEDEAARLQLLYPLCRTYTGGAATAERFRALAPASDAVHFGGHGITNPRDPAASALVFARGNGRPGAVTAREIARMNFASTHVVVLAACGTLTGRSAPVEGVGTLARAFLVAGVPAVVGTLWDVDDPQSSAVTTRFHRELTRGRAPAEALQAAQIAALRSGVPRAQWAVYALMGAVTDPPEPRPSPSTSP